MHLLGDGHSVAGVWIPPVQLGLHSAPHSHGVGVLLLQGLPRPLVPHDTLTRTID